MLAVVEYQQPHPVLQCGSHALGHGFARLLSSTPSTAATASGTAAGSGDGGQFEKPDAVGEFIGKLCRNFGR